MKTIRQSVRILLIALTFAFCLMLTANPALAVEGYSKSNRASSKKGIQITGPHLMQQAVEMGASSVFVNLKVDDLLCETTEKGIFTYEGKHYALREDIMQSYLENFAYARGSGIQKIYVDLICGRLPGLTYAGDSTAALYGYQTATEEGQEIVRAVFTALNEKLGSYVDNWILGSGVNDEHRYFELGIETVQEYAVLYEHAMRILNQSAKQYNKTAQVLVSVDHEWTSCAGGRFNTKTFLQELAALTRGRDYDWGVAISPYPEPLTSANFWNDKKNAATDNPNTQRITMLNLNVMTDFMQSEAMLYGGKARSLSITEIGFNAYENGVEDQTQQAAALAYAYYKAEANPLIDTFIVRAYRDEAPEVAAGMWFGLTALDGTKREAYNVFKFMDTQDGVRFTSKYPARITQKEGAVWTDLVPAFGSIRFAKNTLSVLLTVQDIEIPEGTKYTISAKAYGGSGGYRYRLEYGFDQSRYNTTLLREYDTVSEWTLVNPFSTPGRLILTVMDSEGKTASASVPITNIAPISVESYSKNNRASTKKGIQITGPHLMQQAVELGVENVFVNVRLDEILEESKKGNALFTYRDKSWAFNANAIRSYQENFAYARQNGIQKIYVDVLCGKLSGLTYDMESTASLYALNTATEEGQAIVEAVFTALAEKLGASVDVWILGSEVNDQHRYYEMGAASEQEFAVQYERALRMLNTAAKKYNPKAQVMACVDHEWTSCAGGRLNTELFLVELARLTKANDYDWGIAIHPYPEPLTSSNFWDDEENLASDDPDTQRITMLNLDVMTDFVQTPTMQYQGKARSLAITEIGFNAYEGGKENQTLQAAAIAYAYYKTEANPYLDAFLMRCYSDEEIEIRQKMWFGLIDSKGGKREAYEVFRAMDTKEGADRTKTYPAFITGNSEAGWKNLIV